MGVLAAQKCGEVWEYYVGEARVHAPTLRTILEVENVIREAGGPIKREDIKRKLGKKIMHQTLNIIIRYLDEHGQVLDSHKGIIWLQNDNPKLAKLVKQGRVM